MRLHSLTFPALAFAVTVLAGTSPQFAPSAATTLKKHVTSDNKVKTTKIEFLIDGESPGEAPEGAQLTFDGLDEFTFIDEYVKVADGRPTVLKRTFEEMKSKTVQGGMSEDGESVDIEKESELASKVVVFTWDEKADAYTTAFDDDKGDADLLKDLDADLDFLAFLPEKEVKEGGEWEIDGANARVLLYPGGDLKLESKETDEAGKEINKELRENLKGKLTLTHKGMKEDGALKLIVIEVKGDLDSEGDSETEERGTTTIHVALKVKGEILWDATHNHVHSASFESEDHTLYSMGADVDMDGESHKIEQKFTFEGTQKFSLEIVK